MHFLAVNIVESQDSLSDHPFLDCLSSIFIPSLELPSLFQPNLTQFKTSLVEEIEVYSNTYLLLFILNEGPPFSSRGDTYDSKLDIF